MASNTAGARRLSVLTRQITDTSEASTSAAVSTSSCANTYRTLPRFDAYLMETYLDDLRDLKRQVYDLFKYNPDALTPIEEGLSKGKRPCSHCIASM
jgi:hypothetical protein